MAIVYTTAPKDYDYSHTKELETFELSIYGSTKTWRKVEIDASEYHVRYQCGRYQSGLNAVRDTDPRND